VYFAGIRPQFIHTPCRFCGFSARTVGYTGYLMPRSPRNHSLDDPRLTAMGLFVEVSAGLRATVDEDLEQHGLTGTAFEVLLRLARSPEGRLRMSDLANQATLSPSGLTRVVDRLFAAGYAEREQHERDRRVFHAVITPSGLELVEQVLPSHLDVVERSLTGVLDPAELDALCTALRKVRAVVRPGSDPELAAHG
jgi:MarR family 2-MHQ and catechol resistance regulon transcriptional repressor